MWIDKDLYPPCSNDHNDDNDNDDYDFILFQLFIQDTRISVTWLLCKLSCFKRKAN